MSDDVASSLAEIKATLARLVPPAVTVTANELWEPYAAAESTRLASWRDYRQRWRDHVGPFFGPMQAANICADDVDVYRAARVAAGAKMATVNREIALIRRVLRWSAKRRKIPLSLLHGQGMTAELIHPERNTRTTIVHERAEHGIALESFLAAASLRLRTFSVLLHHTGLRREEASLLRWERVDFEMAIAWVPAADTKGEDSGRSVPLSRDVMALLRRLPRIEGNPFVFASRRSQGKSEHPDTWTHRFGRLVRKLGLEGPDGPPWLHDLRRSFITLARRRGEATSSIRQISGHKTDEAFRRYDVHDLGDVIRFGERMERARRRELSAPRKPPRRATVAPPHNTATVGVEGVA